MKTSIDCIEAVEELDSRGVPTLRVTVHLVDGISACASVPSGASTGRREAHELRDGDLGRYAGKGVLNAVHHVRSDLSAALKGLDVLDQARIDEAMISLDGRRIRRAWAPMRSSAYLWPSRERELSQRTFRSTAISAELLRAGCQCR